MRTTSPQEPQGRPAGWRRPGSTVRLPGRRMLRLRLVAGGLALLMLATTLLGGTGALDRATVGMWTDAVWTAPKSAEGAFAGLQIGGVQNYTCTAGLWSAATVTWQRPAGTPSGAVSYRITMQRGTTTQTTTQTATTYEYSRPVGNFDDVTLTVQPFIGQWNGTSQSMLLDAVPLVGMRCP